MPELSETPFRVYRDKEVEPNGVCAIECAVATDDLSLGDALLDMRKKGIPVAGIMYRPVDGEPGEWLVNPWAKGA